MGKEFNSTFDCDLEGKNVAKLVTHYAQIGKDTFVPSKTLAITIFTHVLPQLIKKV